jgi:hypothetical protein
MATPDFTKATTEHDEKRSHIPTACVRVDDETEELLSPEHSAFLTKQHGTVELYPVPSMDLSDPLNWVPWRVSIQ